MEAERPNPPKKKKIKKPNISSKPYTKECKKKNDPLESEKPRKKNKRL